MGNQSQSSGLQKWNFNSSMNLNKKERLKVFPFQISLCPSHGWALTQRLTSMWAWMGRTLEGSLLRKLEFWCLEQHRCTSPDKNIKRLLYSSPESSSYHVVVFFSSCTLFCLCWIIINYLRDYLIHYLFSKTSGEVATGYLYCRVIYTEIIFTEDYPVSPIWICFLQNKPPSRPRACV